MKNRVGILEENLAGIQSRIKMLEKHPSDSDYPNTISADLPQVPWLGNNNNNIDNDEADISDTLPSYYINQYSDLSIHSMDVYKLFPSIKAGQIVKEEVMRTKLKLQNINYKMAVRYIAKAAENDDEVKSWGMDKWCPGRSKGKNGKKRPGRWTGMTGDKKDDKK